MTSIMSVFVRVIGVENGRPYLKGVSGEVYDVHSKRRLAGLSAIPVVAIGNDSDAFWDRTCDAYSLLKKKQSDSKKITLSTIFDLYGKCDGVFNQCSGRGLGLSRVDSMR